MENISLVFTFIVFLFVFGFLLRAIFKFLEYCFGLMFGKLFFIHFFPFTKRISEKGVCFSNQFEFLAVILENFFETPLEFEKQFPYLFNKVSLMLNQKTRFFIKRL